MKENGMHSQWGSSPFYGGNASYVEALYEAYLRDPNAIPAEWREQFEKLPRVDGQIDQDVSHVSVKEHFLYLAKNTNRVNPLEVSSVTTEHERRQVKVLHLITAYRVRGHQRAKLDPLQLMYREPVSDLELSHHGLSTGDLDTIFNTGNLFIGKEEATLSEIVEALESTYCSSIGVEYMHIVDTAEKRWVQQRMESVRSKPEYQKETKVHILERLIAAEGLEKSLASKYPGYKRFGLEGGDSLIPLLDEIIQRIGSYESKEIVIGMAHRGRLNVLVNTLGKKPAELFGEFEGKHTPDIGSGDVKYHQGFSSNVMTPGGEVHLAMAFNPSHLEIVSPVVQGSVRARQDRRRDTEGNFVVPLLLHGDAAFAGQGVVMETFQMSQTRGYGTGGTIHVIINNQVGFTTSNPKDARSTEYCTDIAKMVQAPIFHVNADDPEAVFFVAQLAVDFRMAFKKDVVIDLICYRKMGHNETDEPSGTQPLMYQKIKKHLNVRKLYSDFLTEQKVVTDTQITDMVDEYRAALEDGEHVVKSLVREPNPELFVDWTPYIGHDWIPSADTRFELKKLQSLAQQMCEAPEGFVLQRQVEKIQQDRAKMAAGALSVKWGFAELMAYATLISEGHQIRLTGQDVGRGTFSHRYAVLHNQKNGDIHIPLQYVSDDVQDFEIYDSFLSEEAVLAFEYGYSTTRPQSLVIWEAQFGDFANGAQVVVDQFISSGEHKWSRLCGLALLLPHGYEGQGPEHSSARLERFLQLCAEHNIQVCVPSAPAQIFHLLRRQAIRPLRKPLVIMSPKSLLRHKLCISTLDDLASGGFQEILPDPEVSEQPGGAEAVDRVILCSGRIYYDLFEKKREEEAHHIALVRIEQLYPFPEKSLMEVLEGYGDLSHIVWCQEEPMNQGAWYCSQHHMKHVIEKLNLDMTLKFAGREASAAPAVGYQSMHIEQQKRFLDQAFNG